MAIYRVELEMDASEITREEFIDSLIEMSPKEWKYHVVYLSDTEEAIEDKRKQLASVRNEGEVIGWSKELRLLKESLLDEIDELEQDKLEEE